MKIKFLLYTLLYAMICAGNLLGQTPIPSQYARSVGFVKNQEFGDGTVFVVADKLLMTARHVIENYPPDFDLTLNNFTANVGFEILMQGETEEEDWVLLKLVGDASSQFDYEPFALTTDSPEINDVVRALGGVEEPDADTGTVLDVSPNMIILEGFEAIPGESGSPVINSDGEVVGILTAMVPELELSICFNLTSVADLLPLLRTADWDEQSIQVFTKNQTLFINSESGKIRMVEIFDLQGRSIYSNSKIHTHQFNVKLHAKGILFVNIQAFEGKIFTKKIVSQ